MSRRARPQNSMILRPRPLRIPRRHASTLSSTADPRLKDLGPLVGDRFALIRDAYDAPRYPIILAHGLFGFNEFHVAGKFLPGIKYWRGITQALAAKGVEVHTAEVSPSGSIESRARRLGEVIGRVARGRGVNVIAHSMGGLDSRYMISRLKPPGVNVLSLTTIATPHRGSEVADVILKRIGPLHLPRIYRILEAFGLETGAFQQLTRDYMNNTFNPATPDVEGVKYYSYGATLTPSLFSSFRQSQKFLNRVEGPNDGLVSIESSKWGQYMGTLTDVSHLDLINWTNRIRWWIWTVTGNQRTFNAVAFYLGIADMLAKEGL